MTPSPPRNNTLSIAKAAVIFLSIAPCSAGSFSAFSHCGARSFGQTPAPSRLTSPSSSLKQSSTRTSTSINVSRDQTQSTSETAGLGVEVEESYPVQVRHQGHVATIMVRKNEPILQALERHSTFSQKTKQKDQVADDNSEAAGTSLALSNIPNECRRGNCLTCSSRIVPTSGTQNQNNILANVDNGLAPTVSSELTKSGYILTCCSYVTGPGVTLELDQNDEVWDVVYRKRVCNTDSKQLAIEAQARLLRRVDEENVGKWKNRMEESWDVKKDNVE